MKIDFDCRPGNEWLLAPELQHGNTVFANEMIALLVSWLSVKHLHLFSAAFQTTDFLIVDT